MTPSSSPKISIQDALREVLSEGQVKNQDDLCSELTRQGFSVTQSKVSRLLRKIGAVKTKNAEGDLAYSLPKEPAPPTSYDHIQQLVTSVSANESLVVVHTSPGAASLIARMIDYHREEFGILGSIAGDDTIFLAPQTTHPIPELLALIKAKLLG